jgi:hypothetical protein
MRPRLTWIIVRAVVGVGVFASLDALRSSDESPLASAERDQAVKTAPSPQRSFTVEGIEEPPSDRGSRR